MTLNLFCKRLFTSSSNIISTSHRNANTSFLSYKTFSTATANLNLKTNAPAPKDFINPKEYFKNKKVLLVGIVGAFTGVCDNQIPPFAENLDKFKAKGIDEIAVVSVNDSAVMKAFGKQLGVPPEKVLLVADFDGAFTRSLEMEIDLTAAKLGKRSNRYAMLIDNGIITNKWVEAKPSELKVSSAEEVLTEL